MALRPTSVQEQQPPSRPTQSDPRAIEQHTSPNRKVRATPPLLLRRADAGQLSANSNTVSARYRLSLPCHQSRSITCSVTSSVTSVNRLVGHPDTVTVMSHRTENTSALWCQQFTAPVLPVSDTVRLYVRLAHTG